MRRRALLLILDKQKIPQESILIEREFVDISAQAVLVPTVPGQPCDGITKIFVLEEIVLWEIIYVLGALQ